MKTTLITNEQSFGTGSNIGEDKFATKTALQAATTKAAISAKVTNGTTGAGGNKGIKVTIWFAPVTWSLGSAALGVAALRQNARPLVVSLDPAAGGVAINSLPMVDVCADSGNAYVWVEAPTLSVAATLSINLIESP